VSVGARASRVRRVAVPLRGARGVWISRRGQGRARYLYRLVGDRVAGVGVLAGRDRARAATLARAAAL
jgi:hypothetical protein